MTLGKWTLNLKGRQRLSLETATPTSGRHTLVADHGVHYKFGKDGENQHKLLNMFYHTAMSVLLQCLV